jgi:HPt (histidine-containing phosphotransfer) domain-containing protein
MPAFAAAGAVCSLWALDLEMQPLLRDFVENLPQMLEPIEQGLQREDHERLRAAAHRLKGSAGAYGFQSLAQTADILVRGGQELHPWGELRDAFEVLRAQASRTTAAPAPLEQVQPWSQAP